MVFYKGTKTKCEEYDAMVTAGQNYQGVTTKWAQPVKINNTFFIKKHDSYDADNGLVEVSSLPVVEDEADLV